MWLDAVTTSLEPGATLRLLGLRLRCWSCAAGAVSGACVTEVGPTFFGFSAELTFVGFSQFRVRFDLKIPGSGTPTRFGVSEGENSRFGVGPSL